MRLAEERRLHHDRERQDSSEKRFMDFQREQTAMMRDMFAMVTGNGSNVSQSRTRRQTTSFDRDVESRSGGVRVDRSGRERVWSNEPARSENGKTRSENGNRNENRNEIRNEIRNEKRNENRNEKRTEKRNENRNKNQNEIRTENRTEIRNENGIRIENKNRNENRTRNKQSLNTVENRAKTRAVSRDKNQYIQNQVQKPHSKPRDQTINNVLNSELPPPIWETENFENNNNKKRKRAQFGDWGYNKNQSDSVNQKRNKWQQLEQLDHT